MPDDFTWERLGHHLTKSLESLTTAVEKVEAVLVEVQRGTAAMNAHIETLQVDNTDLRKEVNRLSQDVSVLNFKSGVWGAVAGLLVVLTAVLLQKIK